MVPEWQQPSPYERSHPRPSSTGLSVHLNNPFVWLTWSSWGHCPCAIQCHIPCDSFASWDSLVWFGWSPRADLTPRPRRSRLNNKPLDLLLKKLAFGALATVSLNDLLILKIDFDWQEIMKTLRYHHRCPVTILDKDLGHALSMHAGVLSLSALIGEPHGWANRWLVKLPVLQNNAVHCAEASLSYILWYFQKIHGHAF